jgi:hypothetical protein
LSRSMKPTMCRAPGCALFATGHFTSGGVTLPFCTEHLTTLEERRHEIEATGHRLGVCDAPPCQVNRCGTPSEGTLRGQPVCRKCGDDLEMKLQILAPNNPANRIQWYPRKATLPPARLEEVTEKGKRALRRLVGK